jgi:hypothetical protein
MAATAKAGEARASTGLDTISFDEAMERYDGQWLLLHVQAVDEQRLPSQVQVVAAGPDEASVCRAFTDMASESERPVHPYYLTEAYPHIRSGEEVQRVLSEAIAHVDEGMLSVRRGR